MFREVVNYYFLTTADNTRINDAVICFKEDFLGNLELQIREDVGLKDQIFKYVGTPPSPIIPNPSPNVYNAQNVNLIAANSVAARNNKIIPALELVHSLPVPDFRSSRPNRKFKAITTLTY